MASFSAELHVTGQVFTVRHCTFGVQQATDQRGRVSTRVRYGLVQVLLNVPDDDVLLTWAATPYLRLATEIVFLNADGGGPIETLHLPAAYCVLYNEEFRQGDTHDGAYICRLTLSDPGGWTIQAGGPASAFVAPAAREHGSLKLLSADWMAAQRAGSRAGKKQSNKAYLGSPPLKRHELQQMKALAHEQFSTKVKVLKEGDEMLTMMRNIHVRAAFQASTKTIFLQPQATYYEISHELKHAQQCAELGVEKYAAQTSLEKETYVYEQLLKDKSALTPAEIEHATNYINSERDKVSLPPLTA